MITYQDWRSASPDEIGPLFDAECARWMDALGWDYRPSCALLDSARRGGRVPGLVARNDSGSVVGWTYFLLHEGNLQIGALLGRDAGVLTGLFEKVLASDEARRAGGVQCFFYPQSPATRELLQRRRFTILDHAYLFQDLDSRAHGPGDRGSRGHAAANDIPPWRARSAGRSKGGSVVENLRVVPWESSRLAAIARMFADAYHGMPEARCFAPGGSVEEWISYLNNIVSTVACGRFRRDLSAVVETKDGTVAGAVAVTALSDSTAHIAQLAVARPCRGQGVGEGLVRAAIGRAAAAGYSHATLLVADSNANARRVYERLGFAAVAGFVFAYRD